MKETEKIKTPPFTDMADELFGRAASAPAGVRMATVRTGGVTITRVEILREGLERPRGHYITIEVPEVSLLDERDEAVILAASRELNTLLPKSGHVLCIGVGNRHVTADALGPCTARHILVTSDGSGVPQLPGLREVSAVAPGASAATGIPLAKIVLALVHELKPAAVLCIDSLSSGEAGRLGHSIQFSDTGLGAGRPESMRSLLPEMLGVPVIAAGIPTMCQTREESGLVMVPRALDAVIGHGAALLGTAINKALQPKFSISQLCYLTG